MPQRQRRAGGCAFAPGIIVKAWREAGYERFMRATIGSAHENDRLLAALAVLNPAA